MHIKKSPNERIVIIGGGFGGLQLARSLGKLKYQVVLIDKNNFHQFQPLFYQVATSGLEPSSIIFPFRKIFQKVERFHFRLAEVLKVNFEENLVETSTGNLSYDHLVIATGAGNNFFGNQNIEKYALPMKSINESLRLRNIILERFEESLDYSLEEQAKFLRFVIAGAGPTGVELAGTLAEMKRFILPKDYPELNFDQMEITIVEGSNRVLNAMAEKSSEKAQGYLEKLGVIVKVDTLVNNFDGDIVTLSSGDEIRAKTLIWAAGIQGNLVDGIQNEIVARGKRVKVDEFCRVEGYENVYAVGDIAFMTADKNYPNGHPQLAQAAIQQGKLLAKNFKNKQENKKMTPFRYRNLGTMATVGRNKAVVELPHRKIYGFFAWFLWMFVHLRSILGAKNKIIVFFNWTWNYLTYNLSLRLIIKRNDQFREE